VRTKGSTLKHQWMVVVFVPRGGSEDLEGRDSGGGKKECSIVPQVGKRGCVRTYTVPTHKTKDQWPQQ